MAIRPADLPPPLLPLGGVGDTGKSMERDARERSHYSRRGHSGGEPPPENPEPEAQAGHIIDESA